MFNSVIPESCNVPIKGFDYIWTYERGLWYKDNDGKLRGTAQKAKTKTVMPSDYIWDTESWYVSNIVVPLSVTIRKVKIERLKDSTVCLRTGISCPQQLIGIRVFKELSKLLYQFRDDRTEVNFCYPNQNYFDNSIFCGIRRHQENSYRSVYFRGN